MQYRYLQFGGKKMKTILRPALTMIELILVIVILGIVASIGAEIIAKVYEGYLIQRAQHRASIKTELAATQIANRLAYAIPGTVVRKSSLLAGGTDINDPGNENDTILQWVGADADSFKAITSTTNKLPGWSGFCDVDASSIATISTPGSNLALTNTIRANLGLTAANPQIYFPSRDGLMSYTATLQPTTATIDLANYIAPPVGTPAKIVEHYKLATSSYALMADGNLWLYYNFSPIRDAAPGGTRRLLLRNVSTFEFRGDGRTIRFKICVRENIGDANITLCKEKAVF